jgi:hypothetical protein
MRSVPTTTRIHYVCTNLSSTYDLIVKKKYVCFLVMVSDHLLSNFSCSLNIVFLKTVVFNTAKKNVVYQL